MNIDMIRAAEARIGGRLRRTPFLSSPFLDRIAGRRVLVKPECLQHTGSFKYRGASAALSALSAEARRGAWSPIRPATMRRAWRWPGRNRVPRW